MEYQQQILEELRQINKNLTRLISMQSGSSAPKVYDFDDKIAKIKSDVEARLAGKPKR